jgi:ORF6N domain
MAANVVNSERAVQASVHVVRAFVRLRQLLTSNTELARKLEELEGKYDRQFKIVFDAIRQLMSPLLAGRKQIGFRVRPAADFMFQLTTEESAVLRYQIGTSKGGRGRRRYQPYAFTEQGVAMLYSVLRTRSKKGSVLA